jgi:hypothetical protein
MKLDKDKTRRMEIADPALDALVDQWAARIDREIAAEMLEMALLTNKSVCRSCNSTWKMDSTAVQTRESSSGSRNGSVAATKATCLWARS